MDHSIGNPGFSSIEIAQVLPSVPAIAREAHVALQHAGAASSGPQKPETSAETRQGKGSKGFVEEVAFANAIAEFLKTSAETRQGKGSKGFVEEVAFANAIAEFLNQQVSFSYDERINQIVVKVIKGNTQEVIRQIPSEEMIDLITKFRKDFRGLIFNRTG